MKLQLSFAEVKAEGQNDNSILRPLCKSACVSQHWWISLVQNVTTRMPLLAASIPLQTEAQKTVEF